MIAGAQGSDRKSQRARMDSKAGLGVLMPLRAWRTTSCMAHLLLPCSVGWGSNLPKQHAWPVSSFKQTGWLTRLLSLRITCERHVIWCKQRSHEVQRKSRPPPCSPALQSGLGVAATAIVGRQAPLGWLWLRLSSFLTVRRGLVSGHVGGAAAHVK